jgi:hypothetical protein
MSLEDMERNASLADLEIEGFANPPEFIAGNYNFKCAIDQNGTIWTTEEHADSDLLGWNDLLQYPQDMALELIQRYLHIALELK